MKTALALMDLMGRLLLLVSLFYFIASYKHFTVSSLHWNDIIELHRWISDENIVAHFLEMLKEMGSDLEIFFQDSAFNRESLKAFYHRFWNMELSLSVVIGYLLIWKHNLLQWLYALIMILGISAMTFTGVVQ